MKQHTVGIDISKAHLDAHRLADGHSAQFDNDPAGFRALIDWIGTPVECVVYEATGPYHRDLEEALSKAKLPLANPSMLRRGDREPCQDRRRRRSETGPVGRQPGSAPDPGAVENATPAPGTADGPGRADAPAHGHAQPPPTAPRTRVKQQHQTQINMFERHVRTIDRKMQTLIAADEARARWRSSPPSRGSRPPPPPVCWPRCPSWAPSAARPPPVWPGWPPFRASRGLGRAGPSSGADGRGRDGSCTCRRCPPCAGTPTWPRCTGG